MYNRGMLNKSKELNNMNKKTDYTTLAKYFTIPEEAEDVGLTLSKIQNKLKGVVVYIEEETHVDCCGNHRTQTQHDVKLVLDQIQRIVNEYKER
jgi:hypothetical protein